MSKITSTWAFICCFSLLWVGCTPEVNPVDDKETASSKDNSFAQNEFDAIGRAFDMEANLNPMLTGRVSGTADYFCTGVEPEVEALGNGTYKMTIDFGAGTTCSDGKTREGKLIGVFSGKWNVVGSQLTITPENYSVTSLAGIKYDFTFDKTITYNGLNMQGHRVYNTVIVNALLSSTSGTIQWKSDRSVEWVEGYGSTDITSYRYLVTGSASGKATNGVTFTAQITQPLDIRNACAYRVVAGVLEVTPTGGIPRVINYGNGTCDDKAELTMGSFTTTLVLR